MTLKGELLRRRRIECGWQSPFDPGYETFWRLLPPLGGKIRVRGGNLSASDIYFADKTKYNRARGVLPPQGCRYVLFS
jgi:hypothetical protein